MERDEFDPNQFSESIRDIEKPYSAAERRTNTR